MNFSTRYSRYSRCLMVTVLAVLACGTASNAQDRPRRFSDPLEGYSLMVPSGANRRTITRKQREQGTVAQWAITKTDPQAQSPEITLALTVKRVVFARTRDSMKAWLEADMSRAIAAEKGMRITGSQVIAIDGQPAVQISGTGRVSGAADPQNGEARPDLVFREAWVRTRVKTAAGNDGPGGPSGATAFLVVRLATLPRLNIEALWRQVIGSLKLTDPAEALATFKAGADRAKNIVGRIRDRQTLADVLPGSPQWFLIHRNGKAIGWLMMQGGPEQKQDGMDWGLRTYALSHLPKEPAQIKSRGAYTDKQFDTERWTTRVQIGSGAESTLMTEKGLRLPEKTQRVTAEGRRVTADISRVFVETRTGMDARSYTEALTPFSQSIYLPRIASLLLPKFVDLTEPAMYVFAEYTSTTDEFVMRCFEVVGPVTMRIGGRRIRAIKAIDRPNFNEEPRTLYLDAKGNVLRAERAGGYVRQAVPAERVLQTFPKAPGIIKAIRRAERRTGTF
ncbi:MAG: hypothetical protein KGY81_01025 [Phycisphaerae bacterium]|nr:hypothetical protein [Phycisphaerae bacterium]